AKYLEAIGGAAAIDAVKSRVIKGSVDVVGVSRGGSFEIYAEAPNKALTIVEAHPLGTVKGGFNGRIGWSRSPAGLRLLKNLDLAAMQRAAILYGNVRLK